MLFTAIAFDAEKNLGRAYNEVMSRLLPDDWVVFIDHDALWTTRDWYRQLTAVIAASPDAGLITAVTNRVGPCSRRQISPGAPKGHDMREHFAFGAKQRDRYKNSLEDVTKGPVISGVVMCLSRSTWQEMGGFASGFFGVDNDAHRAICALGKRIYLMRGLYVYHWYRADGVGHPHAPTAKR
jgi:GT2 family glycosyltransferase